MAQRCVPVIIQGKSSKTLDLTSPRMKSTKKLET